MIVSQLDAEGRIVSHKRLPTLEEVEANCPDGWLEGHHDPDTVYAVNGQPTPRPALPLPAPVATVGADWTVQGLPAGTAILIDGAEHPELTDGSDLEMVFPIAGKWPVVIRPPFPWQEASVVVEVADAD